MSKKEFIEEVISSFRKKFTFIKVAVKSSSLDKFFDGILEIGYDKRKIRLNITTKFALNITDIIRLKSGHAQIGDNNIILVTDRVTAEMADLLRTANIFFIDASANAYIKAEGLFIYNYERSAVKKVSRKNAGSVFYAAGLKLIFNLLVSGELLNENYRKISEICDISVGTVAWIFHKLISEGYILSDGNSTKILTNKQKLFKKWIENYPEKLRQKLIKGRYRFLNFESYKNWKNIVLKGPLSLWGAEAAAEKMDGYLNAKIITIYTKEDHIELAKKFKLLPDDNGNVEILEMFWDQDHIDPNAETVHPLLAYTDLMISENERNFEGAGLIYEKYLSQIFQ
jgi:hypothetical protein